MHDSPVALVTGGNRGLGRETAKQLAADHGYAVVLTARSLDKAEQAVGELKSEIGDDAVIEPAVLDVTDTQQAKELAGSVEQRFGRLDALVNNAGAILEEGWPGALEASADVVRKTFDTNTVGALNVTQAFIPLLLENGGGTVVMVSSSMARLSEMGSHHVAYRLSKTAMNALTLTLHAEFGDQGLRVNAVCPGFVKTNLSAANANAPLEVDEGAKGIVWAATRDENGPSGGFFQHGEPIDW